MASRFVILSAFSAGIVFCSCNSGELDRVRAENDSLRMELQRSEGVMTAMGNVKVLLDSIDANRHVLRLELQEGTSFDQVTSRLENLNGYVKKTQTLLDSMQHQVKEARHGESAYLMMVVALKDELAIHSEEIATLQTSVNRYQRDNKGLVNTVKLQEQQVSSLQTQITARQQELALLEAKIQEMVKNFQVTEAEAVYARAKAVEEAANRTRLAPRKKKETYKESLELYKKAVALGKKEAAEDVARLEKRMQ